MRLRRVVLPFCSLGVVASAGCDEAASVSPDPEFTVTSVSPTSGPLAGIPLTIEGIGFGDITGVMLGGAELLELEVLSSSQLTGTAPSAAEPGAVDIVVISSSRGEAICADCFTYLEPVVVDSVIPAEGPLAGGTPVTITGRNFHDVSDVTVGGVPLQDVEVASDSEIRGSTAAATSAGVADVAVHSTSHGIGLCSGCFRYILPVALQEVRLAASSAHTCALDDEGAAWCWGWNRNGQLGDGTEGDENSRTVPVPVSGGLHFVALAVGTRHSCGLTSDAIVYCWGSNSWGQLGLGSSEGSALTPRRVVGDHHFHALAAVGVQTCALTESGEPWCWGILQDGPEAFKRLQPMPVSGDHRFVVLLSGVDMTCGLEAAGDAYCWGEDDWTPTPRAVLGGQRFVDLGHGVRASDLAPGQWWESMCGMTAASAVLCWYTPGGAPTEAGGGIAFRALAAGAGGHTCGVDLTGVTYCWGDGDEGQLGTGDTVDAMTPVPVEGGLVFERLVTGSEHTCALASDGEYYCWGSNLWGQLGDGSDMDRTVPTPVAPFESGGGAGTAGILDRTPGAG